MSNALSVARAIVVTACAFASVLSTAQIARAEPGVITLPPLAAPTSERPAPALATDGNNVTYAVWAERAPDRINWARYEYGDSAFGPAQIVTSQLDPQDPSAARDRAPLIAADRAGNVTVAWTAATGAGTELLAATKLAGAPAFGSPARIAPATDTVTDPRLFMGDDGSTTLSWVRDDGQLHQRAVIRTQPSGAFGEAFDVYADGGVADEIAGGRDGTVAFGRTQRVPGPPAQDVAIVVRKARGASTLDTPIELTRGDQKPSDSADATRVAVADSGLTYASTVAWAGATGTPGLWAAEPGAAFHHQCQLSFDRSSVIGVDANGWWLSANRALEFSRAPACAPNERVLSPLADGADASDLLLSPDDAGGTHLTWTERTSGDPASARVRTAYARSICLRSILPPRLPCDDTAAGAAPIRTVAGGGATASDAFPDARGNLLVSYSGADGAPSVAVVDREPPQVSAVNAEQSSAPQHVRLSVAATDAYSPPLTVRWQVLRSTTTQGAEPEFVASGERADILVPDPPNGSSSPGTAVAWVTDAAGNTVRAPVSIPPRSAQAAATFSAKLSSVRFKPLRVGAAVDAGTPRRGRGTSLTMTTPSAARATLTLAARVTGRRREATCRPRARTGKRCTTNVALKGRKTIALKAGATTLRLTGRWHGRTLRPGTYRLTIAVQNVMTPQVLTFRIVR